MKRNIPIVIGLAVFFLAGLARGEGPIGLIMDGYKEGCTVKRGKDATQHTQKCSYGFELYDEDQIIKIPDASAVKIQWLAPPYTRADQVNKTTLKIVSNPPETKQGLLAKLGNAVGLLKRTPHPSTNLWTRGGESAESCRGIITPMPGYGATLLPGVPVRFAWCGKGKTILFRSADGKIIYRASVEGRSEIPLTPEEIGLKQGIMYTWEIEGIDIDELYQVRLIDRKLADVVKIDLAEIDGFKAVEKNEKAIRKAVYLQMVSDLYPKEADLYWQSIQLLGDDSDSTAEKLRTRYMQHLRKTVKFK